MKFVFSLLLCLLPLSLNAQGVLETMQADIAANKSKADSLAAELLIQKAKVATLETEMATEKASTVALQAALNVEKAKVASLEASALLHKNRLDAAEAALTLLTARIAALEGAQPPPPPPPPPDPPPPPPPSGRRLLAQSDFTNLGYFDIQGNAAIDLNYGMGLTHRYVNGQLHLMSVAYNGGNLQLVEYPVPALGTTLNTVARSWNGWNGTLHNGPGYWRNIWWDAENNRLWSTSGGDYPNAAGLIDPKVLATRTLNSDGTVSNVRGLFGLAGIGGRATYGGVRKVPAWFRAANDTGKYIAGFGGYTSLMAQNLKSSLGLFLCTFDDPHNLADGANCNNVHILADHRSGTQFNDWYGGQPASFDRGVRNADVQNYFDGGDPRNNPATPPSIAPVAGAKWLSPAPDGLGRWVWGDSNWGCGEWIDNDAGTRTAHGLITIGTFYSGKAYYMTSTLWCDRRTAEIQVYDPAHLAQVKAGTRSPWVKPAARWDITNIIKQDCDALRARNGAGPESACSATTFDATTNRLYVMSYWAVNAAPYNCRVRVFQVGGN